MAWECKKCGHKSGRKTGSSYGCDHDWWDEDELADERERKRIRKQLEIEEKRNKERLEIEEKRAEQNRKLLLFNEELLNTEKGEKLLNGEDGWRWLLDIDNRSELAIDWLDSSFGTEWLSSERGLVYLDFVHKRTLQVAADVSKEEIERLVLDLDKCHDPSGYEEEWLGDLLEAFGKDWLLHTNQAKQYIGNLKTDLLALVEDKIRKEKEKEAHNIKVGCGCIIIAIILLSIIIFLWKF